MNLLAWLRNRRLTSLQRKLAVVEARLVQERRYLPAFYPIVMDSLIAEQARLKFDIDALTRH